MADENFGKLEGAQELRATLTETFGERYELVEEIGHGAYGVVFRAIDTLLGRNVAIKQVRVDRLHNPAHVAEVKRRTEREARLAAKLRHPNIVAIHDIVHADAGTLLIMEFVDGETLDAKLAVEHRLELEEAISVLGETASALDYAHAQGVIHRDIKPANLMLDRHGHVKIMDFGIAKSRSGTDTTSNITATGNVLGTPYYMSPEQARGEASLDSRADIFSLGCVAYECLSGQRPFRGNSVVDVLLHVVNQEPSDLDCESLGLHPEVEQVLGKALAKKAERRYGSATELVHALRTAPAAEKGSRRRIPVVTSREPGSSASFDADFQGQLATRPLPQLLREIQTERRTGILHLYRDELSKRLYFRDGTIVFANSDLESDRLGQLLIRAKIIDESSYARALRTMAKTGRRLGSTLVALGTLDPDELETEIQNQIRSIIYSVFAWESGGYGFETIVPPVEDDLARELATNEIMLEGIRSMASDTTIRKAIGNQDQLLIQTEDFGDAGWITLSSAEGFVLSRVDDATSVVDIIAISPLSDEQTLRCIYGLMSAGLLQLRDPKGKSTTRARKVDEEDTEADELANESATKHGSLNETSHYELLGVTSSANASEIKKAYYTLAKKFHPDHHPDATKDEKRRLHEILAALAHAYQVLSEPSKRLRYDDQFPTPKIPGDAAPTVQTPPEVLAETKYLTGLRHYEAKAYHEAVLNLRDAVRLSPEKVEYHKLLAQALIKNPKWCKEAESHFRSVLDAEPFDTECYLGLAEIYESNGLSSRARKMYDKVLTLDPDHSLANEKVYGEAYESRAAFLRKLMGNSDEVSH